jgi:hypothetical protein
VVTNVSRSLTAMRVARPIRTTGRVPRSRRLYTDRLLIPKIIAATEVLTMRGLISLSNAGSSLSERPACEVGGTSTSFLVTFMLQTWTRSIHL